MRPLKKGCLDNSELKQKICSKSFSKNTLLQQINENWGIEATTVYPTKE